MIVVSDTSPLSNLLQIQAGHLLHDLFGDVFIPPAVANELCQFHSQLPVWVNTRAPADSRFAGMLSAELDSGEAEAIALAKEIRADWLLMDEKRGREVARREGLSPLGLGGVLIMAKHRGLISVVAPHLDRLESEVGFHLGREVKAELLRRAGELSPG
jgi:predicted nucleic acid-binding protein